MPIVFSLSGAGALPRLRWRSARPGLHDNLCIKRYFLNQDYRTRVDCQTISFTPPADIIGLEGSRPSAADPNYPPSAARYLV